MNRLSILTLAFAGSLAITTPSPAKNVAKIVVTPASEEGAILMRVPSLGVAYSFLFSKNGSSGFGSRAYLIEAKPAINQSYKYVVRTLKPGSYRLDSISQQKFWSVCLKDGTFSVEIRAGEIAYVGDVDPRSALNQLYSSAIANGDRVTSLGGLHTYWSDIPRPLISRRDADGLQEAESFVRSMMPASTAPVRIAEMNERTFVVSGNNQFIQICG
ncbi:hypothetical protein WG907_05210 [Sphingobium sp. AN558]|uniref:hypothetical protein n=1 Tax=Sphingobium sp. AN558 TaxID=3133442 RepID=UPI0030C11869